jgi:uncharacterized protein (UPF0276 family)
MNRFATPISPAFSLCTTYEAHDPVLLDGIMPYVDFIEVTPDTIAVSRNGSAHLHPDILDDLKRAAKQLKIIAHGVGLSIGSYDNWSADYLDLLQMLYNEVPLEWHSEHLAYSCVDGQNLNTMLALPRTREMAAIVVERIKTLQNRFPIPFLLENISRFLPDYPPEFTEAGMLNHLTSETGCELILDLYNLECDAFNHGFNIRSFLHELDLNTVREIHIAGGAFLNGFQLDVHSNKVADSTLDWLEFVIPQVPNLRVVTYEILPQAVKAHGQNFVIEELARLADFLNIHKHGTTSVAARDFSNA